MKRQRPSPPLELPKKRVRVPSSCVVCRRRKIKCNKARPSCDQCSATGLPDVCRYEDPGWMNMTTDGASGSPVIHDVEPLPHIITNAGKDKQVESLLARIKQLEQATSFGEGPANTSSQSLDPPLYYANERVEMIDRIPFLIPMVLRKATIEYHGCMSPIADIKSDPYLKVVWLHMWKYLDLAIQGRTSIPSEDTPINFKTQALTSTVADFLELRRQKMAFKKTCEKLKDPTVSLEDKLLEHIPPRRTILYLLDIYFTQLYPLLPIVQQHAFLHEDMERVLGGWVNQHARPSKLNLKDSYEVGYAGILFAVMACATLTLKDEDLDAIPDLKPLKKSCPAVFARLAYLCVQSQKFLRQSSNLRFGLVLVLLKFYYNHCPEDDTASDMTNGRINMGVVISMFRSNGIFTDPVFPMDSKKVQVYWRRLWHTVMDMDASDSVLTGMLPRFMDDSSYDTKVPEYDVGMSQMEISVIDDFKFLERRTKLYRKMSVILYQRKNDATIGQLLDLADELRNFAEKELVSFEHALKKNTEPYTRAKKVTYLLELNSLEAALRQRAISHFNLTKNSKMIHQQFSIQLTLLSRILNTALNICYNLDRYFGAALAFYVRATLLLAGARVMFSLGTLIGRCAQSIKAIPMKDQTRTRVLREFQAVIIVNMERSLQLVTKLNIGFYNAQRTNVGFSFFLAMLKDPAFDFDKARDEVTARGETAAENKFHHLQGMKVDDISSMNFLNDLLDVEIDGLKQKLHSDLEDVLQPLIGERIHIQLGQRIFDSRPWNLSHHFAARGSAPISTEQREEAELNIQKSISIKYMNHKVDTIFAGSDTIKTSEVMTPVQMAGLESASASTTSAQTPKPADLGSSTLTAEEFGELFGLFDEYNWLTTDSERGFNELGSI